MADNQSVVFGEVLYPIPPKSIEIVIVGRKMQAVFHWGEEDKRFTTEKSDGRYKYQFKGKLK